MTDGLTQLHYGLSGTPGGDPPLPRDAITERRAGLSWMPGGFADGPASAWITDQRFGLTFVRFEDSGTIPVWVFFSPFLNQSDDDEDSTMLRNVAEQPVRAQLINLSTGLPFSGTVTVYVTGDDAGQILGTVGSGEATAEGNGLFTYLPSDAETDFDQVSYTFVGDGAIPVSRHFNPRPVSDTGLVMKLGMNVTNELGSAVQCFCWLEQNGQPVELGDEDTCVFDCFEYGSDISKFGGPTGTISPSDNGDFETEIEEPNFQSGTSYQLTATVVYQGQTYHGRDRFPMVG